MNYCLSIKCTNGNSWTIRGSYRFIPTLTHRPWLHGIWSIMVELMVFRLFNAMPLPESILTWEHTTPEISIKHMMFSLMKITNVNYNIMTICSGHDETTHYSSFWWIYVNNFPIFFRLTSVMIERFLMSSTFYSKWFEDIFIWTLWSITFN